MCGHTTAIHLCHKRPRFQRVDCVAVLVFTPHESSLFMYCKIYGTASYRGKFTLVASPPPSQIRYGKCYLITSIRTLILITHNDSNGV